MQSDNDLAVARRYFTEVWNPRNLAALDELFPPTFTLVVPSGKEHETPASFVAETIEAWHNGFDGTGMTSSTKRWPRTVRCCSSPPSP